MNQTSTSNKQAGFPKLLFACLVLTGLLLVACGLTPETGSEPPADGAGPIMHRPLPFAELGLAYFIPPIPTTANPPAMDPAGSVPTPSPPETGPEAPANTSKRPHALAAIPAAGEEASVAAEITDAGPKIIGSSYAGLPIASYRLGQGPINVVFIGGMHGGYEWNTILLAYQALDYFQAHPAAIPPEVSLYIIPNANPDGLFTVSGKEGRFTPGDLLPDQFYGRFNGRGVDLNRNWDCDWTPVATWRDQPVSGGDSPFSEPETRALRDTLLNLDPALVLFWHSAADGVFAAGCKGIHTPSAELASLYGLAAGYPTGGQFDYYPITGDAGNWLTTQGIPSITVELLNHEELDWQQNLAGMLALMAHFEALGDHPPSLTP